jgi:hypothetical protein
VSSTCVAALEPFQIVPGPPTLPFLIPVIQPVDRQTIHDCPEFCKHQMARPRFLQTNLMAKLRRNFWGHRNKSTAERISSEFCKQNHNKKLYVILVYFSTRHLWHHSWMRGTQQWWFSPPTMHAIDMTTWQWRPLPPKAKATSLYLWNYTMHGVSQWYIDAILE